MGKRLLRLTCRVLRLLRSLPRIGNAKARRDHQNLRQHLFLTCLDQHAPQRRIQRQPCQLMSQRGHAVFVIQGSQFVQQFITGPDRRRERRIQKWKGLDLAQAKCLHPQNDFREVRPLDFRLGKTRAFFVVVLTE